MRIKKIYAKEVLPVRHFEVDNLSDLVVIAGRNGVGKTRLINHMINSFQNIRNQSPNLFFEIESTNQDEKINWTKNLLVTSVSEDFNRLAITLQRTRRRKNLTSSILYVESNRTIQNVTQLNFSFDMPDPDEENVAWNLGLGGLSRRYNDTLQAIFKKIQNQKTKIANRAISLQSGGEKRMDLNFEDPLETYKDAFQKLLGPKKLIRADLRAQKLIYELNGQERNIDSLSSGEKEVVKIVFDFILRKPSDCIIFMDEPELHLHPELTYRLINTLRSIGENNQFILCTHNPELISSTLNDSVIFLQQPEIVNGQFKNQAVLLSELEEKKEVLTSLGQSLGVVSLGKNIVLIEGNESSLDKMLYGSIIENKFPDLTLVPSEGIDTLKSFSRVQEEILNKTIWGVKFSMLCDGDANILTEKVTQSNLRFLPRYHIENYFLDSVIIAGIFKEMEDEESWLIDSILVREELKEIAKSKLTYTLSLNVSNYFRLESGNMDLMLKGCDSIDSEKIEEKILETKKIELERVSNVLNDEVIKEKISILKDQFNKSFNDDSDFWIKNIPGKVVLSIFCAKAKISVGRFKKLYISYVISNKLDTFKEVEEIFEGFSNI